jgi:hypothetical protein
VKENSDGNDTNVGSIGNSIEEDIKILESIIKINNDYLKGIENQTINQKEIKAIEHILSDYKRVLKENEELKAKNKILEELLQGNLYELYKYYRELASSYQGNCIPAQKVKDKIEKYKNMCISSVDGYENYFKDNYDELIFRRIEQLEKELLDEFIDESNEKYQFTWNRKNQALKLSQTPPPEPQLPTKTICESFSKKVKNK